MIDELVLDEKAETDLPLAAPPRSAQRAGRKARPRRRKWPLVSGASLLLAAGGVIGFSFQPSGLQGAFTRIGLASGDGAPVAGVTPPRAQPAMAAQEAASGVAARRVAALGRLIPAGDVTEVALPFGAGDARIAALNVTTGDRVEAGRILAVLDSEAALLQAVAAARSDVAVRAAMLAQSRASARASLAEATATLESAEAVAEAAAAERERSRTLLGRGAITQAAFDEARRAARQAESEVARARASLSRWRADIDAQEDVVVAMRSLEAAQAALSAAERDVERAYVRAPISGVVLDVHVRAGEAPGAAGLIDMGDVDRMTAEFDVYQAMIGRVSVGDAVAIAAEALDGPLSGVVSDIGLVVGRQTLTEDDPAANTDARVVKVTVALDARSSTAAARLTGLQVTGWIAVGGAP